ncbi:MAG TPA: hypothetical protein EYN54_11130 [Methylococcaceae bacterium]|nr:hypothetical protein [Methylococcaceae bacterium]
MFEKRLPPKRFPCTLTIGDDNLNIHSKEYYDYINEAANKLYQVVHGYKSQPGHDYFCSTHPQESNCFMTALIMDNWMNKHEFNDLDI